MFLQTINTVFILITIVLGKYFKAHMQSCVH